MDHSQRIQVWLILQRHVDAAQDVVIYAGPYRQYQAAISLLCDAIVIIVRCA